MSSSTNTKIFRPWDSYSSNSSTDSCTKSEEKTPASSRQNTEPNLVPYPEVCSMSCWPPSIPEEVVMSDPAYWACVAAKYCESAAESKAKSRPKKFLCPYCQVGFSNNGQLKGHVRIHTGERPFKCEAEGCGKSFTRNEELTRHKRIHTGLRPFGCSSCGKKFGRKDHLKKHARTHLPVLPHPAYVFYPYLYGY